MAYPIGQLATDGIEVTGALPPRGIFCPRTYYVAVVFSGHGSFSVCGQSYEILPDSLLLLSRGDICFFGAGTETVECCVFSFTPECLWGDREQLLTPFRGQRCYAAADMSEELSAHLARLWQLRAASDKTAVSLARLMLSETLLHLSEMKQTPTAESAMARAAAYLAAHAKENVTLDRLSDEAGVSKFYLCRAFRDECGLTPHAYLGYLRVLMAEPLLESGMGAKEVGEAVGFRDYSTFFRTYKKVTRLAPTAAGGEEIPE